MTKPEEAAAPESESGFTLSNLLLLAVAIAALVGIYAFANVHRENEEGGKELPHGTIQLEVARFDAKTRKAVAELERLLAEQGRVEVLGPNTQPLLLPGAKPGDEPVAKKLEDLTDEEWDTAWRYALVGEYWVPRMFRLDGKACVIRFAPILKDGKNEFDPDTAARINKVLEGFGASFEKVRPYSRLANLGSQADRDAINVTFGVQTAWVTFKPPEVTDGKVTTWNSAANVRLLMGVKPAIPNPRFRSVRTAANWVRYYQAVLHHVSDKELEIPSDDAVVDRALTAARRASCSNGLSTDYVRAMVDVTTDAEGTANAELFYFILANVQEALKIDGSTPYLPKIVERLKDGPPAPGH